MRRLFYFDALQLWRDRLAAGVLLAGVLACAIAVVSGMAWQRHLAQEYVSLQEEARSEYAKQRVQWAKAPERSPLGQLFLPMLGRSTIALPLASLPDFTRGRSGMEPTGARVRLNVRPDNLFARYQLENPESLTRGSMDLGWVALVIAPLLLIGLGYGVFTNDRDSGTARLWLAQAGTPLKLLAVRSINRLALVVAPLLLAAGILWCSGPPGRCADIGLWLATMMLALLVWWAVILLVNSFRIEAETAALLLVGLWTLQVFAAPTVIAAYTAWLHPLPSRFAATSAARSAELQATRQWEKEHPELSLQGADAAFASYPSRRGWVFQYTEVRKQIAAALAPFERETQKQRAAQLRLGQWLALLSPSLMASNTLAEIAQTDFAAYSAQRQAAIAWLVARNTLLTDIIINDRPINAEQFDAIPRFDPAPLPAPSLSGPCWLLLYAVALGAVALWRLRRVRPL